MTDNPRDMLQNVMGHIDTPIARRRLGIGVDQPEWLTEARAALAAAPQPLRINRVHLATTISHAGNLLGWRGDTIADDLIGRFDITLRNAAAPQPAPEQGMTRAEVGQMLDAKRHDREALVEAINQAQVTWNPDATSSTQHIADALLARGLRLPSGEAKPRRCAECDCEGGEYECTWIKPGPDRDNALQQLADLGQQADRASETMAWAVVGEDGEVIPGSIYPTRDEAERVCDYEGERVVRVAIRVVEGGDDER